MKLISHHGTIIQFASASVACGTVALVHRPLVPATTGNIDADIDPAEETTPFSAGASGPLSVEAGSTPGLVHLRHGGFYVCADPNRPELVADRTAASVWETFLCLDDTEIAVIRVLLKHGWLDAGDPGARSRLNRSWAQVLPAFYFKLGDVVFDMKVSRPRIESVRIDGTGSLGMVVTCDPDARPLPELRLDPAPPECQALPVVSGDAFIHAPNQAVAVAAPPDLVRPPLFASAVDQAFFFERDWKGGKPRLGEQRGACEVRRMQHKFVLLQRFCEGILFDELGTFSEVGYFHTLSHFPDGMRRDGATIMLARPVLDEAVELSGSFAIVFNPHLSNYYHWIVEAMMSLDIMREYLPPGTRLLMPGTLKSFRATGSCGFDHRRILDLLGFDDIPVAEVDAPICHVEEAIWLQNYSIDHIPGAALCAFRDRVLARLGRGLARNRRIYIQRRGARRMANAEELEAFCIARGFMIIRLEDLPDDEQIRIFQEAEFVIGAHGAGLSNLLFCQPNTGVIEISPDVEFRPFFWQIADRLGLVFGLMPCPTSDGTFQGDLHVDVSRLGRLYDMIEAAMVAAP